MCDSLNDLPEKRKAVAETINDLCDDLRQEVYLNTIAELKEQIKVLEANLDRCRELLQAEMNTAKMYKDGYEFLQKVKTITVR